MNRSMPGLPVHHQLPEFNQTHIHRVSDAIQPSHPPSSPSPPAPNPSQHHQSVPMSQLFAWGGQSTGVSALASFLPKKFQGWSPSECYIKGNSGFWKRIKDRFVQPNPKENQPWIFSGRTDAEAPIYWPPAAKSGLIGKDPDAGKDWRQKDKGVAEDEMVT